MVSERFDLASSSVPENGSVTDDKVAANAGISADKLRDGATKVVMTAGERASLAAAVAGTTVPADGSVTNVKVATNAGISADKLADGSAKVVMTLTERARLQALYDIAGVPADASVTNAKVAANAAISADKLADGSARVAMTVAERAAVASISGKLARSASNRVITGDYTLVAADATDIVLHSTALVPATITLPQDSAATIGQNVVISWRQVGAGQLTFAPGTGATLLSLGSAFKSAGVGAEGVITKISANTWLLSGNVTTATVGGGSSTTILSDTFTGANGTAPNAASWTVVKAPTTGGGATIQSNELRLSTGTLGGYNSADNILLLANIGAQPSLDTTLTFRMTNEVYPFFHFRSTNSTDPNVGSYMVSMDSSDLQLGKTVGFTYTQMGANSGAAIGLAAGTTYKLRFRAGGTTVQAKVWVATDAEPSTWNVGSVRDTSFTTGYIQIGANGGGAAGVSGNLFIDNVNISVPGTLRNVLGPSGSVDLSTQGTVRAATSLATLVTQINASSAGDTVTMAAGTYTGTVTITKSIGSGSIRVVPVAGATVNIQRMYLNGAQGIDIRGINLTGDASYGIEFFNAIRCQFRGGVHTLPNTSTGFMVWNGCSDIVVEDVTVNDALNSFYVQGFAEAGRATNVTFQRFRSTNVSQDHVFLSRGDTITIQDFEMFGHTDTVEHSDGVQIVGARDVVIQRGHIWNTRAFRDSASDLNDHGIIINYDDTETPNGRVPQNISMINLLIHDQTSHGITIAGVVGATIRNCTLYDNGPGGATQGLSIAPDSGNTLNGLVITNNIMNKWSQSGATMTTEANNFVADASGPAGTARLTGTPGFVDSANQNYDLVAGSQNIGSGTATGAPTLDMYSMTRPSPPSRGSAEVG